jgi:hypothetical protein
MLSQILGAMLPSMNISGVFSVPIIKWGAAPLLPLMEILLSVFITAWIMWQKRIFIRV